MKLNDVMSDIPSVAEKPRRDPIPIFLADPGQGVGPAVRVNPADPSPILPVFNFFPTVQPVLRKPQPPRSVPTSSRPHAEENIENIHVFRLPPAAGDGPPVMNEDLEVRPSMSTPFISRPSNPILENALNNMIQDHTVATFRFKPFNFA